MQTKSYPTPFFALFFSPDPISKLCCFIWEGKEQTGKRRNKVGLRYLQNGNSKIGVIIVIKKSYAVVKR